MLIYLPCALNLRTLQLTCLNDTHVFIPWHNSPHCAKAVSLSMFHDDTWTQHTRYDSSGRVISPKQRPLLDNTQQSRKTSMPPAGIKPTVPANEQPQTHALNRAATGPGTLCYYSLYNSGSLLRCLLCLSICVFHCMWDTGWFFRY
jgi:hypothetical protein